MKIAFLLPNYSKHVAGSLLVYYRFAEGLARSGHEIDIYHPVLVSDAPGVREGIYARLWCWLKNRSRHPVSWIKPADRVHLRFHPRLEGLHLPHARVVAFSWRSVEVLSGIRIEGRPFGYIVEYETWVEAIEPRRSRMEAAYRSGPPMLCSSKAVETMLKGLGVKDVRSSIHGVDIDIHGGTSTANPAPPWTIGFPVRTESVKSPEILEQCLGLLRERWGSKVTLWGFGGPLIPEGIRRLLDKYHVYPDNGTLASLYRNSLIFAVPSRKEGFGMPAAEAMSAGCAVVSTDNGGIHTFGVHEDNCLIVPANSPHALADAISRLLHDQPLRERISMRAPASVAFLSWTDAFERFKSALELP